MAKFKDTKDREWEIVISAQTVKMVRAEFDLNILEIVEENSDIFVLFSNLEKFVDVLFFLVSSQAKESDVNAGGFGSAMFGDVILDARAAFIEALVLFFPDKNRREAVRKLFQIAAEMEAGMIRRGMEEIAAIDQDALARKLIDSVGNSLGSSA